MKRLMTVLFTMGFLIGVSVTFAQGRTMAHCQNVKGSSCGGGWTWQCAQTSKGCHGCFNTESCYTYECMKPIDVGF